MTKIKVEEYKQTDVVRENTHTSG